MSTLESIPAELQLVIFGFTYSGRQIHITERDNGPVDSLDLTQINRKVDAEHRELLPLKAGELECAEFQQSPPTATRNQLLDTRISKSTYAAAWQAHLTSATWEFASVAAAKRYVEDYPLPVRYIKNIRVVAGESVIRHSVSSLSEAGCKLQRVELLKCTQSHLGITRSTWTAIQAAATAIQAAAAIPKDVLDLMYHCLMPSDSQGDGIIPTKFADCLIIQTISSIPTLEDVAISTVRDCCQSSNCPACDWILHAREAELFILQAAARDGTASHARSRNIAKLQAAIATIKVNIVELRQTESSRPHCDKDFDQMAKKEEEEAPMLRD